VTVFSALEKTNPYDDKRKREEDMKNVILGIVLFIPPLILTYLISGQVLKENCIGHFSYFPTPRCAIAIPIPDTYLTIDDYPDCDDIEVGTCIQDEHRTDELFTFNGETYQMATITEKGFNFFSQ
jgi:hypothetical protein